MLIKMMEDIMIYLNCEVKSGLGEDTFWTWFAREFPSSSFEIPQKLSDEDIVLRYSTLGFLPIEGKQVALCWELYPQMKKVFSSDQWNPIIDKVNETARYSTYRTVATKNTVADYEKFGSVEVIPIGVDTDLYKPLDNKKELREKYDLPSDKKIGIWIGTYHPMKGYSDLIRYAAAHQDIYWIVIWKWQHEAGKMEGAKNFVQIPQEEICELINASDFFLSTSKLCPFYMAEWEAMACNIPFVFCGDSKREFVPSANTRDDVFRMGWDRKSVKKQWEKFLLERGIRW
jgi:glycosyltransferase involved in cell wall biosynthesis